MSRISELPVGGALLPTDQLLIARSGDNFRIGQSDLLANTTVIPGTYTQASITVDATGRITDAEAGDSELYLTAPNGDRYAITVSNAGVLATTLSP